jgi:cell division transport system permease protein
VTIGNWLRQHGKACGAAARRIAGQPVNTLLSALVVGIALALPAGGEMLLVNFLRLAQNVSATPQLSIFLTLDANKKDSQEIDARLKRHVLVRDYRYVPREEARSRLKQTEGLAEVIDSLPRNPFPDAFVVTPKGESPEQLENLKLEFANYPKVEHVQLDSLWVKRLDALLRLGQMLVTGLAVLLGVALVAVTFNTIRLQILTQRAEVEVSRLLGASDAFIRRPFFYFGALQGLLGGVVAWVLVLAAAYALARPVSRLASLYSFNFALRPLPLAESLFLIAFAVFLGWLGAWLSVSRHLRDIEPR